MFATVTPLGAIAIETAVDLDVSLPEIEKGLVANAVPARRAEFATTRHCARVALRQLGFAAVPIPSDGRGAPVWPPAVVGSMTHCDGIRAAMVALAEEIPALGIDAEPNVALPAEVQSLVVRPDDIDTSTFPGIHVDTLIFSAKEATFKAWYPLTGQELEFHDVVVIADDDGALRSRVERGDKCINFDIRWTQDGGLIGTCATVAKRSAWS